MKKTRFKEICEYLGIQPKALKQHLKKRELKIKEATERTLLDIVFIHAPDLAFTRDAGDETCEYLDKEFPSKLVDLMAKSSE